MGEGNAGKPVKTDMNLCVCFFSSRNIQIAPFGGTGSDEDRVKFIFQKFFYAFYPDSEVALYSHVQNVVHFFIKHFFR